MFGVQYGFITAAHSAESPHVSVLPSPLRLTSSSMARTTALLLECVRSRMAAREDCGTAAKDNGECARRLSENLSATKNTAKTAQAQERPALTRKFDAIPRLNIECFSCSGNPNVPPSFNNG